MDLPDDVLDEVLRRVPPRCLAACRRVCRTWRDAIDGRGLVHAHLAPGPVRGMFVSFTDKRTHRFFSRGTAATTTPSPSIDGSLLFLPNDTRTHRSLRSSRVRDHCNGLLLYKNDKATYVCNPATRRWATLPCRPRKAGGSGTHLYDDRLHLVFDPTVSLHHRVMFFPEMPRNPATPFLRDYIKRVHSALRAGWEQEVEDLGSREWPPYSYALQVFSSETGLWEERCFVRQGDAVTTVSEMWSNPCPPTCGRALRCYAGVYWQGAFYLNCPGGFIMRFSLLEDKYIAIKTPRLVDTFWGQPVPLIDEYGELTIVPNVYLAKSKQGVYYTALQGYRLRIWILRGASGSCQMPEWEVKHQVDLKAILWRHSTRHHTGEEIGMSWTLAPSEEVSNDRGKHGWDSSDDCIIDADEGIRTNEASTEHDYGVNLLGYHPYKEIVFLANRYNGFAYYLESSKLQYLGRLYPTCQGRFERKIVAYIYTPCSDDLLPAQNNP